MTEESIEPAEMEEDAAAEAESRASGQEKVVPVGESIRYRGRAQQAEKKTQQLEQQLREAQAQIEQRLEQLASAEAQRDEMADRITRIEHQRRLEQVLLNCGVHDVEAATLLLEKGGTLSPDSDEPAIQAAVEKLLLNRPHLCSRPAGTLPQKTAGEKRRPTPQAQLVRTAERAARSGDRRDIAEYLRLRRQLASQ